MLLIIKYWVDKGSFIDLNVECFIDRINCSVIGEIYMKLGIYRILGCGLVR